MIFLSKRSLFPNRVTKLANQIVSLILLVLLYKLLSCRVYILSCIQTHVVSCGAPNTHDSVNISSYNSTLEGSVITFWCTDALLGTNTLSSVCHRNGNWIPNPVSQCTTLGMLHWSTIT